MLAAQQTTKEATHLQSLNKKLQMPEKSTSMDKGEYIQFYVSHILPPEYGDKMFSQYDLIQNLLFSKMQTFEEVVLLQLQYNILKCLNVSGGIS